MLKKIFVAALIALPCLGFAQAKFGVVNTQPIVEAMPEMKAAQTQLQSASDKYQEQFKAFTDEYNKKMEEFQKLTDDTPKLMRDRKAQDLAELENRINEFRSQVTNDMQRQQESLFAPIQQKVVEAINAVGKEGNFTFIFENQVPVYTGSDVVDVTAQVKAKLGI